MPSTSPDHRPRVAAERRERMKKRLLESAMVVLAQKGMSAHLAQDIVALAEVSQGSFYNYFNTNEELLHTLAEDLSNETVHMINLAIEGIDDPVLRIAMGTRSYLHLMLSYRIVAQNIARGGLDLVNEASAGADYLPRDLLKGQAQGCFDAVPLELAIDMVGSTGLMAIKRIAEGHTGDRYPEQVTGIILRALGLSLEGVTRAMAHPLPALLVPPDSLFARAQARLAACTRDQ
jgi:AcrR family transcriptional regulator